MLIIDEKSRFFLSTIVLGNLTLGKVIAIAQLIVESLDDGDWMEVHGLDETARAEKGFGSSGLGTDLKEVQLSICFL